MSNGNLVPDEVEIELNVLHVLMLDWVASQIDGGDVVSVDQSGLHKRATELKQEIAEPRALRDNVGNAPVFGLSAGARHDRLTLGRPRHKGVVEEDTVTRRGATRVRTTTPIRLSVSNKVKLRGRSDRGAELECAADVPNDPL